MGFDTIEINLVINIVRRSFLPKKIEHFTMYEKFMEITNRTFSPHDVLDFEPYVHTI